VKSDQIDRWDDQIGSRSRKPDPFGGAKAPASSCNFDRLSGFHNYELIAVVCDADFGRRMTTMFEEDFAGSREIKRKAWRNRGWGRRIPERFSYVSRNLF